MPERLLDATAVGALIGAPGDTILAMNLARGLQPASDPRPEIPLPERAPRLTDPPQWAASRALEWAAQWLRVGAETQAEIDAAERAVRDAHAERDARLVALVPAEAYGVPVFSDATLDPSRPARPPRYLRVRQRPVCYDHGRLLRPQYYVEGIVGASNRPDGEEVVLREILLLRGTEVVPEGGDIDSALRRAALRIGTPEILRWRTLYDAADPTLWREAASDLQALMVNHIGSLFGDARWPATAGHLGLDRRAKDGGLNNVQKKLTRARDLTSRDSPDRAERLARASALAQLLGIDLDADLRHRTGG